MLILTYVALIPPLFLLFLIYRQDKIEQEPKRLILKLFLLGAIIPIIFVKLFSGVIGAVISLLGTGLLYSLARWFIQVALLEEFGKYFVLTRFIWNDREFNYRFDGIVYSVAVSLGFAAIENLLYVFSYGVSTGILRAITAIPAHTIFAVYMGYYLGEAKFYSIRMPDSNKWAENKRLSLLIPVLLHGMYDFIAGTPSFLGTILFYGFVLYIEIKAVKKVKTYSKSDTSFMRREEQ